jgi:hypothetical protein
MKNKLFALLNKILVLNILGCIFYLSFGEGWGEVNGDVSMDVSKLSSGVYFIKTTDKNGNMMNGKFVKE